MFSRAQTGASTASVFGLFLLLFQRKAALCLRLFLGALPGLPELFVLLLLQFQGLLGLCPHAAVLQLPFDLPLHPLGVSASGFLRCRHRRPKG